jgi:hypothetical protein
MDELKSILPQNYDASAIDSEMSISGDSITPPEAVPDRIALFVFREVLDRENYLFHGFWNNGKQEAVRLQYKWSIHGVYRDEQIVSINAGEYVEIGCLTKADLSSQTHLWVRRVFETGHFSEVVKLRLPVQRLLFGQTDQGWMRWDVSVEPKVMQNRGGNARVVQGNRARMLKGSHRIKPQHTLNHVAVPMSRDLHLESLLQEGLTPGNTPIILFQVQEAERYLNRALMAGLKEVYLIHGIGEGALRMRLHDMLSQRQEVDYFANEYHPRYGWGATVVRF